MDRRRFLATSLAASLLAAPVSAQAVQDRLIEQLKQQGASVIRISRTLLGRTRLVAEGPGYEREIIFNPRTGEILRDYWEKTAGEGTRERLLNPGGSSDERNDRFGGRGRDGGAGVRSDGNSGPGPVGSGGSDNNSGSGGGGGSQGNSGQGGGGGNDDGHDDSGHDDDGGHDGGEDDDHDD